MNHKLAIAQSAAILAVLAALSPMLLAAAGPAGQFPAAASGAPQPPYVIYGNVTDEALAPLENATITVKNIATGGINFTSTASGGYYQFDLSQMAGGYAVGQTINITATGQNLTGWAQTTVTGSGGKQADITAHEVVVAEFPAAAIVLCAVFTVGITAGARRRR